MLLRVLRCLMSFWVRENPKEQDYSEYRGPSLAIAYEQLKGVAETQMSHGADIDAKASAMFALATAMVGIAVPLVLIRLGTGHPIPHFEVLVWLSLVPVVLYVAALFLFVRLYWLAKYQDLNDPDQIKRIIKLSTEDAYISLYRGIESIHKNNRSINNRKVRLFKWLFAVVGTQTLLVIGVALWVAWASL